MDSDFEHQEHSMVFLKLRHTWAMIYQFSKYIEIQPWYEWNFCKGRPILVMISVAKELAKNHTIDPVYKAFLGETLSYSTL